jgi:hypothetical protein
MPVPGGVILETAVRAVDENPLSTNFAQLVTNGQSLRIEESVDMIVCNAAGSGFYYRTDFPATTRNVEVGFELGADIDVAAQDAVMARTSEPGVGAALDGYSLEVVHAATDTVRIGRRDNGTLTVLATLSQECAAGDQFMLQCIGDYLIGWRKPAAGTWAAILSARDTTYPTGRIAVFLQNTAAQMRNFMAQPISLGRTAVLVG